MNHLEQFLYWLSLAFEATLCALVYARNLHRRLPLFGLYAAVIFTSSLINGFVYLNSGYRSTIAYHTFWITIGLTLLARCFAIAELCHYQLRVYRGIWELSWRVLLLMAMLFSANAALDAWGQPNRIAIYGLTVERDVGIASVVILLALYFLRDYYILPLEPAHRELACGLCLVGLVDFLNNTFTRYTFTESLAFWFYTKYVQFWPETRLQIESANNLWNLVRMSAFIIALSIWCFALRKPLSALKQNPELLPAEIYTEVSPAVNLRLRAINDRLLGLLKP